jgi:outer membrane receptor for ferrienterochelin and colicin
MSARGRRGIAIATLAAGWLGGGVARAEVDDAEDDDDDSLERMTLDQLMQVKVHAVSLRAETPAQAPADVTVITAQDLERYQLQSVADALGYVPGFDVLYDLSTYNVGVRGISAGWGGESNILKVTLDGQDVAFRPTTGVFLGPALVPILAIDRIEIVRGPLSAIYGANAFLGFINVVPRTARSMGGDGAIARATYINNWGHHGVAGDLAGWATEGGVDAFVAASIRADRRDGLTLPATSPRHDAIRASGISLTTDDDHELVASTYARLGYDAADVGTFILDGNFEYVDRTANFNPNTESLRGARLVFHDSMARLRYHRPLQARVHLDASASVAWGAPTRAERIYDPFRAEADYLRREYAFLAPGGALTVGYDGPHLSFRAGSDYALDHEELPTLIEVERSGEVVRINAGRQRDFTNLGVFAHVDWNAIDPLHLVGGARVETHSLFGTQASYRAAAIYAPTPTTAIKALVGSAFKAPSPMLMFGGEHPRLFGVVSNTDLEPQYAVTGELALSTQILDALHVGVDTYVTRVDDLVELDTVAANPKARNRARIDAAGAEAEARLVIVAPAVDLFANGSYVHTHVDQDIPVGIVVSSQTRLYPAFAASAGGSMTLEAAHLRPFALLKWTGRRAADKSNLPFLPQGSRSEYFLPAYTVIDAGLTTVGLRLGGRPCQLGVRVRNVIGADHVEPGFSGIDVPGEERQVYVTFEQQL